MPRLRDHERRADANDVHRLSENRLDAARVEVARKLARTRRRLDVVEPHDPSFRLRDDLLGKHDDVVVLEIDRGNDQRREVGALIHLGNPGEWDDAKLRQFR